MVGAEGKFFQFGSSRSPFPGISGPSLKLMTRKNKEDNSVYIF